MIRKTIGMIAALVGMQLVLVFGAQASPLQIVAVVNDDMISSLDVEQRIQAAMATTGLSDSPEVRERMRSQILRGLIDEQLQKQEARRLGLVVTAEELRTAFGNINKQQQMPPGTFQRFMLQRGVSLDTVSDQLRAQIAWSKVIMQSLRSKVRVSEDEVNRVREQLSLGQDISEFQISSIVLAVDQPSRDEEVRALAEKLVSEIEGGANFAALARQFSAGSAEVIEQNQHRWVQLHQLEPLLAKNIARMQRGEVTVPVRTLSGYHIIKLHDQRTANTARSFDSEVLIKQVTMKLKPDAQHQEAEVLLDIARQVAKYPGTCHEKEVAGATDLDELDFSTSFQRVGFKQLQPQVQNMLANLRVGDVSEPFATPDGIHLVMLCERVEMPPELPPVERVREKLMQDKLELEAAKRLRDLRREAFIEVRS